MDSARITRNWKTGIWGCLNCTWTYDSSKVKGCWGHKSNRAIVGQVTNAFLHHKCSRHEEKERVQAEGCYDAKLFIL